MVFALLTFVANAGPTPPHVEYIVPVPPAGSPDLVARNIAKELQQNLNIPFPVFNKPGAGSMLATRAFVNDTDGNRVLSISSTVLLHTKLPKDDPLNIIEDIDFVGPVVSSPLGLITSPKFKTYKEFAAYAKKNEVVCGVVKPIIEQSVMYLAESQKLNLRLIPHRGTIDVKQALLSGTVDCTIDAYGPYKELEKDGRVSLLAYFHKNPQKPEVYVIPGNHPRLESAISIAIHTNMSPSLRKQIVDVVSGLKNNEEFVSNMNNLGYVVTGIDQNYKQFIRKESKILAPIREKTAE